MSSKYIDREESAPGVDAVEVVRCKDCKYGEVDENENTWCTFYNERIREMPNGYCWHGERKKIMADITKANERIATWHKNLEKLKNGAFGSIEILGEFEETLAKYWQAQAEAGYPGANDSFMYFMQSIKQKERSDGIDSVCYSIERLKKKYTEGGE